jgi:hypothetical protein
LSKVWRGKAVISSVSINIYACRKNIYDILYFAGLKWNHLLVALLAPKEILYGKTQPALSQVDKY